MYCEKCSLLSEGDRCPACGSRKVRPPKDDDYCYLTEKDAMWSGMLEDIFRQEGIPCMTRPVLGAGFAMKVGPLSEKSRFYIPFSHLQKARELAEALMDAPVQQAASEDDTET